MLVSHTKQFIFIHIYKTAGTSVMDVIRPYARLVDRLAYTNRFTIKFFKIVSRLLGLPYDGMKSFTGLRKHAKADEIREKLGEEMYDSYFKFVFVRNPFDFLVSLFFYIKQAKGNRNHGIVKDMEFKDFLTWYVSKRPPRQVDFITDPKSGESIVDYIGRFETLATDISKIKNKLQLKSNFEIKHKNRSHKRKDKNYKTYYDTESKALVEEYFKRDLDLLGYTFEGVSEQMLIVENI